MSIPLCELAPVSNGWGHFLSVRPPPRRLVPYAYWDKARIRTANVATITATHGARLLNHRQWPARQAFGG
jgi:hypothetical protein